MPENPKFSFRTIYTPEDFYAFYDAAIKNIKEMRTFRVTLRVLAIVFWALGTLMFVSVLRMSILDSRADKYLLTAVILLAIGTVFFPCSFGSKRGRRATWNNYRYKDRVISFEFYDYYFVSNTPDESAKIKYSAITKITEDKDLIFLFNADRTAYLIPKRELESPDEFMSFIRDRQSVSDVLSVLS